MHPVYAINAMFLILCKQVASRFYSFECFQNTNYVEVKKLRITVNLITIQKSLFQFFSYYRRTS